MSKMDQALNHMWEQIKSGVDFAVAHEITVEHFMFNRMQSNKLIDKYDKCK